MGWVKVDDGFAEHPKVLPLSDLAFRLHVSALCYTSRALTDGFVPEAAVAALARASAPRVRKAVSELLTAGVWDAGVGGYAIHDFLDYNPSRKDREQKRDATRNRVTRHRNRKDSNADVTPLHGSYDGVTSHGRARAPDRDPVPVPDPHAGEFANAHSPAAAAAREERLPFEAVDPDLGHLHRLIASETRLDLNDRQCEQLNAAYDDLGHDIVAGAIREFADAGGRSWTYLQNILARCKREGGTPGAARTRAPAEPPRVPESLDLDAAIAEMERQAQEPRP